MQTAFMTDDLLTVRQVAEMFHLGEKSIRDRILAGRLPAQKLVGGKQWLIRREDALGALHRTPSHESDPVSDAHPGVVPADTDPMQIEPNAGIIRRTYTPEGRARAIAMLQRLREGDAEEQARTWKILKTALAEDRLSYRKLFPNQETSEETGSSHGEAP